MSSLRLRLNFTISAFIILPVFLLAASVCHAAVDYYLKIDGISGKAEGYHMVVKCSTGNHVSLAGLKAGKYSVQLVNKDGSAIAMHDNSISDGAAKGQASDRMAVKGQGVPDKVSVTISIKGQPPAAGVVTGRRMWKPMTIVREVDASSPKFFTISAGDVNGDGMADITISL